MAIPASSTLELSIAGKEKNYQEGPTDVIDGHQTSDWAVIGQQLGAIEAQAGSGARNLVPSKLPTLPKMTRTLKEWFEVRC